MNEHQDKIVSINIQKVILAIIISMVVLITAQGLVVLIMNLLAMIGLPIAIGNVIGGILYPVFTFFGILLLCKKVLNISLAACKITKIKWKPVWCIVAVLMPLAVSILLLQTTGHWENVSMDSTKFWITVTRGIAFVGFGTGLVEEIVFRGVIMSVLEYRFNKNVAITVPSVLFALFHIIGVTDFLSIVQILVGVSLVGILFSLVTYESGNIWYAALMHGIWNATFFSIIHIGTVADKTTIYNYVLDSKSSLITGGDFGIEASIISAFVFLLFIIFALLLIKRNRHQFR